MTFERVSAVMCVVLALAAPGWAGTRKECKASVCGSRIAACRSDCASLPKRRQRSTCRAKCKPRVTKACRSGEQACAGGQSGGGQCRAYTPACPARSLLPLRVRNATCTGASEAAQPCDDDFQTTFRVTTPWRTAGGECCVIDTCRGATAFGIYDNLASTGVGIAPGTSPVTAPVVVVLQSLSSYFQRPPTATGLPGQWGQYAATVFSLTCATPVQARVISSAGGVLVAAQRGDYRSYDTRPVPPPTGSWDFLQLSPDETSVTFAPPQPPLLPACGSAPDTLACQPHVFRLDSINFPGDRNPITEILSERISLDKLCDDAIVASASGTFRRQDGSECSVTIYGQAKIPCDSNGECSTGETCVANDPSSETDLGTAFPGWAGQSCLMSH